VSIWKPKIGPLLTPGRSAHAGWSLALAGWLGAFGRDQSALAWGGVAWVALATAWELSTPLHPRAVHRRADLADWLAFVIPYSIGALIIGALKGWL